MFKNKDYINLYLVVYCMHLFTMSDDLFNIKNFLFHKINKSKFHFYTKSSDHTNKGN